MNFIAFLFCMTPKVDRYQLSYFSIKPCRIFAQNSAEQHVWLAVEKVYWSAKNITGMSSTCNSPRFNMSVISLNVLLLSSCAKTFSNSLTLSWRRSLSYRNQFVVLVYFVNKLLWVMFSLIPRTFHGCSWVTVIIWSKKLLLATANINLETLWNSNIASTC